MSINRAPGFFHTQVSVVMVLESLMMVSSIALLLSWPLGHTIALRNISLVLGFFASAIWLMLMRPKITLRNLTPLLLLLCVPLWLVIKLLFFPVAPSIQWAELSSLWLRVILAVPFAYVCGMLINRHPFFLKLLITVSCVYPLIPLAIDLYVQFSGSAWRPAPPYVFKTKVSGVYWLMWSCSLGYALMHHLLLINNGHQKQLQIKKWSIIVLATYLTFFSLVDFFLLNALNGLLIGLAAGSVLVLIYIRRALSLAQLKHPLLYLATLMIILGGLLGVGATYKERSADYNNKLAPLYWDIKASLDLDKTRTWQRSDQVRGLPEPINDRGQVVNISTYERTSWLIKGFSTLLQRPLGTGYTSGAFHYFMTQQYPGSTVQKTHCAWLDLGLGLGIPGLIFLYLAIGGILLSAYQALQAGQFGINVAILWMLSTMFVLWWPAELGEREYIESLFYMVALFAGALIKPSQE